MAHAYAHSRTHTRFLSPSPQGQITSENWHQFAPYLLMVLLMAIYIPLTVADIVFQLRAEHRARRTVSGGDLHRDETGY